MAKADDYPAIEGKRFIPRLAVGCLLFAALLGFGTYFIGVLWTPYLKKKNAEYLRTHRPPSENPAPPSAPLTR